MPDQIINIKHIVPVRYDGLKINIYSLMNSTNKLAFRVKASIITLAQLNPSFIPN